MLSYLLETAHAQVFDGPGLRTGIEEAALVSGPIHNTPREIILSFLYAVLYYVALLGVCMIVIAGILLLVSMGNDTMKDRAKRIIWYTVIGLVIIICARLIVGFLLYGLPNIL
jgi:hypothetical protein